MYREPLPDDQRRQRKRELLADLSAQVRDYAAQQGIHSGYEAWLDAGLNNAHLASVATYFDCVPGFERLLAAQGGKLPAYYTAVRALAKGPPAARRALCARTPAAPASVPATAS